jgi:hypothetical protein
VKRIVIPIERLYYSDSTFGHKVSALLVAGFKILAAFSTIYQGTSKNSPGVSKVTCKLNIIDSISLKENLSDII